MFSRYLVLNKKAVYNNTTSRFPSSFLISSSSFFTLKNPALSQSAESGVKLRIFLTPCRSGDAFILKDC